MTSSSDNSDPNQMAGETESSGDSCRYLGQTFQLGEKICHDHKQWVCEAGVWAKTGETC